MLKWTELLQQIMTSTNIYKQPITIHDTLFIFARILEIQESLPMFFQCFFGAGSLQKKNTYLFLKSSYVFEAALLKWTKLFHKTTNHRKRQHKATDNR